MISAKDELAHLLDCISEEEAQRVLDVLDEHYPDLYRHLEEPPTDEPTTVEGGAR